MATSTKSEIMLAWFSSMMMGLILFGVDAAMTHESSNSSFGSPPSFDGFITDGSSSRASPSNISNSIADNDTFMTDATSSQTYASAHISISGSLTNLRKLRRLNISGIDNHENLLLCRDVTIIVLACMLMLGGMAAVSIFHMKLLDDGSA